MALDRKLLLIITITMLHAWTERTFGVAVDLGRRERSGREKLFKSYNSLANHSKETIIVQGESTNYI